MDENVARGATLLDCMLPGWHKRIDLERLDIDSPCDCVLGQLYGSFSEGLLRVLGPITRDAWFFADKHAFAGAKYTEAWKDLVINRELEEVLTDASGRRVVPAGA